MPAASADSTWRALARLGRLAACLGLAPSGLACPDPRDGPAPDAKTEPPAESRLEDPPPTLTPVEQLDQKLQLYLACIARSGDRMERSFERLTADVELETGRLRRRGTTPFVLAVDAQLVPCREAATRGSDLDPPAPEIERAALADLAAAEAYADAARALRDHFEPSPDEAAAPPTDASDVAAAAAAAAAGYAAWLPARETLKQRVQTAKDGVDVDMLELIEKREGKGLRWSIRVFVLAAKRYTRCMQASVATCVRARESLAGSEAKLEQAIAAAGEQADAVFWMSAFAAARATYAEAVDQRGGARKSRPADLERLARAFEDVARAADTLRFDLN